jgi:hypothetical protein
MGNAPDIPPEELNLTHMRTITALVGSMQRVQHEVDEIGRQFAASLFRLRSSFDLIDQLFHTLERPLRVCETTFRRTGLTTASC